MITLKNNKISKVIQVPTSVNDITQEVLEKLTKNIVLPQYRALIALCWKVSFGEVFFNQKSKDKQAQVVPFCAKINVPKEDKDKYDWLNVGKKVIISRSGIEMGVHVHIPNAASMQSISKWAEDVSKAENPTAKGININLLPQGQFILIEFKVVSLTDITGVIESDVLDDDPFLINE